jgi:hypothetical protein
VGEPLRIVLSLCTEIGYRSVAGTRSWHEVEGLLPRLRELAERSQSPDALAMCLSATGLAHSLNGTWRAAADYFGEAEQLFRAHGTELRYAADLVQVYHLSALLQLGETLELIRLLPLYLQEAIERGDQYAATRLRTWRSNVGWLILDRPDKARRMADESPIPAIDRSFHLHHFFELLAHCRIDLYLGDAAGAWQRIEERWPELARSHLLHVQSLRIEAYTLRAGCALARALALPDERASLLALAARFCKQVERDHAPWGDALGTLLRGSIAAARGERTAACLLLDEASARLDAVDMALLAAVARRRRGELLGGDEGRQLVDAATQWMKHRGVIKPARLTAMYAPGFAHRAAEA